MGAGRKARVGRDLTSRRLLAILRPAATGLAVVVGSQSAMMGQGRAAVEPTQSRQLSLWADEDDDDLDGTPDGEQASLPPAARADTVAAPRNLIGATIAPTSGGEHVRWLDGSRPMAWGRPMGDGARLQGLSPGKTTLLVTRAGVTETVAIFVYGLRFVTGTGASFTLGREHLSLERTPPSPVDENVDANFEDADAVRLLVEVPDGAVVPALTVESLAESGAKLDELRAPKLRPRHCTHRETSGMCFATAPIRFVVDDVDRNHPFVAGRSLISQLGGAIVIRAWGKKAQADRILGPRGGQQGPIGRFRLKVRPFVVRMSPGGTPAIGGTDVGAISVVRAEFASAAGAWGQCGVSFGPTSALDVKVVDPPPAHLLAIGDELALPATGGEIRVRVSGKPLRVPLRRGEMPAAAAYDVARALEKLGFGAVVSPNARVSEGAFASIDVSARKHDGSFAVFDADSPKGGLSTDASLSVRIGELDLADGLDHFVDADAMAGTLEERTLLKALDDGRPETIEVVIVPLFAGGGRIGESFIASDLSSLRNVVLLDRSGIRARVSSLTLAHELGHVLLDQPGHPDDYGVDTPTLLMDSDAADTSAFGPRRLTLEECDRAVRQSGPTARLPLLEPWPISPMKFD